MQINMYRKTSNDLNYYKRPAQKSICTFTYRIYKKGFNSETQQFRLFHTFKTKKSKIKLMLISMGRIIKMKYSESARTSNKYQFQLVQSSNNTFKCEQSKPIVILILLLIIIIITNISIFFGQPIIVTKTNKNCFYCHLYQKK